MRKLMVMGMALCLTGVLSAKAADAKENWSKHCAKCHGEDGKAETKMGKKAGAKNLTDPKVQDEMKDDKAFKSIKEGIKDGDKTVMKSYGEEGLSDDEIKALVAYVRTLKK
jgi:cytochrome c6